MSTGVVVLNFGEPPTPERDRVVDYLKRIFYANADLEDADSDAEAHERARQLAERRASPLIEEYEEIGGSPLNEQARHQAELLELTLRDRGYDARTYLGMQYTEPFIEEAAAAAIDEGMDQIVGFPAYPLCGPSTNVLALDELDAALEAQGWDDDVGSITGWHRHPTYNQLRADNIAAYVADHDLDLTASDTALVFSAHGTPTHYLESGSRYDIYVEEYCDVVASLLGVEEYELGYQNHENRDIPWTEPELEDLVADLAVENVVVEPISFLHEQSETLSELDIELDEDAIDDGQSLYRVPIPHDDDRLPEVFADLVEPLIAGFEPGYYQLRQCQCRDKPGTMCLNAPRE
jgi:ferrochelatase